MVQEARGTGGIDPAMLADADPVRVREGVIVVNALPDPLHPLDYEHPLPGLERPERVDAKADAPGVDNGEKAVLLSPHARAHRPTRPTAKAPIFRRTLSAATSACSKRLMPG